MQSVVRRSILAAPAAALLASLALAGPGAAAHAPVQAHAPSTQMAGIIMKDGNICDPFRHMGC
jgi:uncharacterized membrane protein